MLVVLLTGSYSSTSLLGNTKLLGVIPRSELVQKSEYEAKTVIEKFPNSKQSKAYYKLIQDIFNNNFFIIPKPMDTVDFEEFFKSYQHN